MAIRLPAPVYKPAFNVTRASHVVHRVRDLAASRTFYADLIGLVVSDGFRLSEYVVDDAGNPVMVFLQRKGDAHDVVFAKGLGPRLHHVAYAVPETQNLMTAADLFVRDGFGSQVAFGPARHFSPGLARFLYLRNSDGHRVELFPSHDQTIDIEDEPLRWQAPDFQIGGWQDPPGRSFDEASAFGAG